MPAYPVTNYTFTLEEALRNFGFEIDDKGGACVAHGYIYPAYGEIHVEFYQSFLTNYQTDMRVYYEDEKSKEKINLYLGVAPINKRDFNMLMGYLLPSDDFKGCLGIIA